MRRTVIIDEFFDKQPKVDLVEHLSAYNVPKIVRTEQKNTEGCFNISKIFLDKGEFANNINLQTVFDDFNEFISFNEIEGDSYPVKLVKVENFEKEEFLIEYSVDCCLIKASEQEGIRRAIINLEDDLLRYGGNVKICSVHKKAIIKHRISRGFSCPIDRPPHYIKELDCDYDYYPENLLRKLMHAGINAIWVATLFDDLLASSYIVEFGKKEKIYISNLNALIEKCERYGIQVFVFAIIPLSLFNSEIQRKYPNIHEKYSQVHAHLPDSDKAFCTSTEFGKGYLAEAVERLFTLSPNLAGLISITFGERVTSCATTPGDASGKWINVCPLCKSKTRMQIVTDTVDIIVSAMKKVNPNAEFISWTYGQRGNPNEYIEDYASRISSDAIMMQNFEDDGRVIQLGKKRFAIDYYLCYTGPSDMYSYTAKMAKKYNKRLYAKLQVCTSHELATVPFIPVPGIIYDKITRAKAIGTSGVMEGWFFGNYPCIMSKAVELLSYDYSYADKNQFLAQLAGIYFANGDVDKVVNALNFFETAYANYPINVMFNYYGPMHDGIVWDLALLPKNFSLPRTWQLQDKTDGDRIWECLYEGHTINEAISLCTELSSNWNKGCELLKQTAVGSDLNNEIISVSYALNLLFSSGLNILKFYKLRNDIGYNRVDYKLAIDEMEKIVENEIINSEKMVVLCNANKYLGYHSEAEGYKFFPEKLNLRINNLKNLLSTEFPIVKKRIKDNLLPLEYYHGVEDYQMSYNAGRDGLSSCEWEYVAETECKFKVAENGDNVEIEFYSPRKTSFLFCNEFELFTAKPAFIINPNGKLSLLRDSISHQSVLDERIDEQLSLWDIKNLSNDDNSHFILLGNKKQIGFVRFPYKMQVRAFDGFVYWSPNVFWCRDENNVRMLGKENSAPGDFGWIK